MTLSLSATHPVGLTAYVQQYPAGDEPTLRISLNQGSVADLSAKDAVALSSYIRDKFPQEIFD
jgi:hypothetical protein